MLFLWFSNLHILMSFTRFRRLYYKQISGQHVVYSVAGVISGILISIFVVILIKIVHLLARASVRKWNAFGANIMVIVVQLRRVCLFVAYLCAMCWLTLHYSETIGLKRLFFNSEVDERTSWGHVQPCGDRIIHCTKYDIGTDALLIWTCHSFGRRLCNSIAS